MLHVDNFTYGALNPALAFIIAWLGAFVGLRCASRARAYQGTGRAYWLLLAALSIGATGTWVVHFIAMLGFTIPHRPISYSVSITVISMVVTIAIVAAGLLVAGYRRPSTSKVLIAGVLTGFGVTVMTYAGMAAILVNATMSYDKLRVGESIIIAMVASTLAFSFALRLRSLVASAAAASIVALGVTGMHYMAMASLRVWPSTSGIVMTGVSGITLLLPIIVGITVMSFVLIGHVALAPTEDEIRAEHAQLARLRATGLQI